MEKIKLPNSFLAFIEYDKEAEALFLTLKSGKQYKYTTFPEKEWEKLKTINNKGSYIAISIIGNRKYQYEFMGIVSPEVLNRNTNSYYKFLAK